MAFPTVEGTTGLLQDGSSVTAHAVPYPTGVSGGIQANDILLITGGIDEAAAGTTITNWNGFTQLFWSDITTNVGAGGAAWLRAAGGETGTLTVTSSLAERAVFQMYCIRGAHTSSAPEAGTVVTASSTNPDPPSLTPSWGAEDTLWFATTVVDIVLPSAAPTNYTNLETGTILSAVTVATARRTLNATSEDPGVFTMATDQWLANTIAIRPAGTGATTYNKSGFVTTGAVLLGADVFESTETGTVAADTLLAGPSEYTPAPGPPIALPIVVRSGQVWRRS